MSSEFNVTPKKGILMFPEALYCLKNMYICGWIPSMSGF